MKFKLGTLLILFSLLSSVGCFKNQNNDPVIDPNAKDNDGQTALIRAVRKNDTDSINNLVQQKVDVNVEDVHRRTALMFACGAEGKYDPDHYSDAVNAKYCHPEVVKILIGAGADLNWLDQNRDSAIFFASSIATPDCTATVELLLKAGADPDISGEYNKTPLIAASGLKHVRLKTDYGSGFIDSTEVQVVKDLLKARANPSAMEQDRGTPLSVAADVGNFVVVQELIKAGADVSIESNKSITCDLGPTGSFSGTGTALTNALLSPYPDADKVAVALVKAGAPDVCAINANGFGDHRKDVPKLIEAIQDLNVDRVELLLRAGANPNVRNPKTGLTALMEAALTTTYIKSANPSDFYSNMENPIFKVFFTATSSQLHVNDVDGSGQSVLMRIAGQVIGFNLDDGFASNRQISNVMLLAAHGADLNQRDSSGDTPLIRAVRELNFPVIDALVKAGADKNAKVGLMQNTAMSIAQDRVNKADKDNKGDFQEAVDLLK